MKNAIGVVWGLVVPKTIGNIAICGKIFSKSTCMHAKIGHVKITTPFWE